MGKKIFRGMKPGPKSHKMNTSKADNFWRVKNKYLKQGLLDDDAHKKAWGDVNKSLPERIDSFIEKQLSLKTYFCKICGQRHKLNSNLGQSHYTENFGGKVEKQEAGSPIRFKNVAEARAHGIKLPPEFDEPEKPKVPKTPLVKKPSQPRIPKRSTGDTVGKVISEVGRQISPKGPGYRSPEEIASDIQEARRISRGIKGLFKPRE